MDLVAAAAKQSETTAFLIRLPESSAVFVGTLVEVGPPPESWSGYDVAVQALTFDVERSLRGELGGRVTVHHWIVAGSREVGAAPGLRPPYTAVGERYLVALGAERDGKRMTLGEGMPPEPVAGDLLARAEAALTP